MISMCPICAAEFDLELSTCPACDCRLVPASLGNPDSEPESGMRGVDRSRLVELCRPRLHAMALLVKQTLELSGIRAVVQGGHSMSLLPQLAFGGELRILVEHRQLRHAREVYAAYFEGNELEDDGES